MELGQMVRSSPYLKAHLEKYQPSAIISVEKHACNELKIEVPPRNNGLKACLSYQNYQPEADEEKLTQFKCYFCENEGKVEKVGEQVDKHRCGDCKKVVCGKCRFLCGKCGKTICQLDRNYDYEHEHDCCYNC